MTLLADIAVSTEALGVVGIVVTALTSAVVFNFRLLMKQHREQVADLKRRLAKYEPNGDDDEHA